MPEVKSDEVKADAGVQAYCVKCKGKREMQDPLLVTMKTGRPATQGTCPVCVTKMFKIGK